MFASLEYLHMHTPSINVWRHNAGILRVCVSMFCAYVCVCEGVREVKRVCAHVYVCECVCVNSILNAVCEVPKRK